MLRTTVRPSGRACGASAAPTRRLFMGGALLAGAGALILPAAASAQTFDSWLEDFRREARAAGIRQTTLDGALGEVAPVPRVIELDRRQPESRFTFAEYRERVLSEARITQGRALLDEHAALLQRTSADYGVPPELIVALWGLETSYGRLTGGFEIIPALTTLAYDGRRSSFFRKELISALRILDDGVLEPAAMTGSWAGAMGQSQFMPSTYLSRAVDADGDGRADIWTSLPDVFASIANYMNQAGWDSAYIWGRPVELPSSGVPEDLVGLETRRPLAEWQRLGVRRIGGADLPAVAIDASLIRPDAGGDSFLAYDNFRTVMAWNRSTYFALTVGLLTDLIGRA